MGIVFPAVAHFGWCACSSPCRTDTCRNALMNVYCNVNSCLYDGLCGNGLSDSTKLRLMRNNGSLCVVVGGNHRSWRGLGEYLGEMDVVPSSTHERPRNRVYQLVMKSRPESPADPVRVAINA